MALRKKGKIRSSSDGLPDRAGILSECEEQAIKQILVDQIKTATEMDRLTKADMAARMRTKPPGP